MESLIIGFGGEAGHGKSTCANIAEQWFLENGYSVKVISFADKLKEVCKIMFRLSEKDLNTQIGKSTYRNHIRTTPREIMQKFGTEVCREGIIRHLPTFSEGGRTIWTWNVERDILECAADVILIPDVRFPDELQMLRNFGCIFINVIREVEVFGNRPSRCGLCNYERRTNDRFRRENKSPVDQEYIPGGGGSDFFSPVVFLLLLYASIPLSMSARVSALTRFSDVKKLFS